ncbi:lysoplasmalogenase family protein [Hellea balneolensis]|uniref:lysoplasmalogenase family protein n=1 Tax=Hellea balneolensis TaxID=287478 RepID=UPI00040E57CD|nr:lysoplasmalogenase family protein [Hellea balneolensis]
MSMSLGLYGLVVLALLLAELRQDRRAQFFFKPLAAIGFVILALQFGALETVYGKYILAGLIACAAGDVLLLSRKSQKLFMSGMAAFAIGHLGYVFAFLEHGLMFGAIKNEKPIDHRSMCKYHFDYFWIMCILLFL